MVGINYDFNKIPAGFVSVRTGVWTSWRTNFTYPGMGRVMLEDVTLYEAKKHKGPYRGR